MTIKPELFLTYFVREQEKLASSIDYILRMYQGRKLISVKDLKELQELATSIVNNQVSTPKE